MGSKSHVKLKRRRPIFKCDICQRKYSSSQALKSHQYAFHKIKSAIPSKTLTETITETKIIHKKVPESVSKVTKPVKKPEPTRQVIDNSDDKAKVLALEKVSDSRKIEFECPKCDIVCPTYFDTYRHIQKFHCVNSKGQKVPPDSLNIIKPLRVEMCVTCHTRVGANDFHACNEPGMFIEDHGGDYLCMGCNQKFASMQLFDLHVSGLHADGVESLFFPNMGDFNAWRNVMQNNTKSSYLVLGKSNMKHMYHCTYSPLTEARGSTNSTHLCPSSIVVQEFKKGIQAHFYKNHHGHSCPKYECPGNYKRYLITSLMQEKDSDAYGLVYNEKDLYCQFKVLLESIIVEAAKVKIDDLKLLLGKALEMTSVINSYDEDDDTYTHGSSKDISNEQIAKALDSLKSIAIKRKATNDLEGSDQKREKIVVTPKIVNSFSMAINSDEAKKEDVSLSMANKNEKVKNEDKIENSISMPSKNNKVKKDDTAKKTEAANTDYVASPRVLRNTQLQSPTFNDTYKDFVDKNFNAPKEPVKQGGRRKPPIKSLPLPRPVSGAGIRVLPLSKLVGQKEIEEELAKDLKEDTPPNEIKYVNNEMKNAKIAPKPVLNTNVIKPTTKANNGPNTNQDNNSKDTKVITKQFTPKTKPKKQVLKTKIGTFKPSVSPKSSPSPKKTDDSLNKSIGKVKPDIEYEVMEQENDCNILILKI